MIYRTAETPLFFCWQILVEIHFVEAKSHLNKSDVFCLRSIVMATIQVHMGKYLFQR